MDTDIIMAVMKAKERVSDVEGINYAFSGYLFWSHNSS